MTSTTSCVLRHFTQYKPPEGSLRHHGSQCGLLRAMSGIEYLEVPATPTDGDLKTRVYRKRWLVLAVYSCSCVATSFQWAQFVVVGDLVARYYGVTASQVEWTSLVFMASIALLTLPACFLIDCMGTEWCLVLGGLLAMVGSWFKMTAVSPGRFPVLLAAQTAVAVNQAFTLAAPRRLVSTWFPARELPVAAAAAFFGTQLGLAVGLVVPPAVVRPHDVQLDVGKGLKILTSITAVSCTIAAALVVLLFRDSPRLPPDPARGLQRPSPWPVVLKRYGVSLRNLLTNWNYLLLLAASGVGGGALYVFVTQLGPVVAHRVPNGQQFAGWVGFVIIAAGCVGHVACGLLLDWTHKYKEVTLAAYTLMVAATGAFAFALKTEDPIYVYLSAAVLGVLLLGSTSASLETAAELTHPESEGMLANLPLVPAGALGALMSSSCSWLLRHYDDTSAVLLVCACAGFAAVNCAFLRRDYRRHLVHDLGVPAREDICMSG